MYIKPKRNSSKKQKTFFIVLVAVFLVIAAGAVTWIIIQNNSSSQNNNTQTSQQNNNNSSNNNSNSSNSSNSNDPKKVNQYEGENPNNSEYLTGSITAAFLANNTFTLRVSIDQYVADGGTCTLTMTQGSNIYSQDAPLIADVSTSTCQGFDSPGTTITSGKWHVVVDLKAKNGKKGKIEGDVNL